MPDKMLSIGQKVVVKAITKFDYDEHNNRKTYKIRPKKPFEAFITGAVHRKLGKYDKGYAGSVGFGIDDGFEPPSLVVKSTLLVYTARKRLFGKEFDVQQEDIVDRSLSGEEE